MRAIMLIKLTQINKKKAESLNVKKKKRQRIQVGNACRELSTGKG